MEDYKNYRHHPIYVKMNHAGKRKFWKLIESGVPPDEALYATTNRRTDMSVIGKPLKRSLVNFSQPDKETTPGNIPKTKAAPHNQHDDFSNNKSTGPLVTQKPQPVIVSLVEVHNTKSMSNQQINLVHKALLDEIGKCEMGMGPKFIDFTHNEGSILITCESYISQNWLVSTIPKIKPWPDAELSTKLRNDNLVATTYLPRSEADTVEEALKLISKQNKTLKTMNWKVIGQREYEEGYVVTLSMNHQSVGTLRKQYFKASLGFKNIFFKIIPLTQIKVEKRNKKANVEKTDSNATNVVKTDLDATSVVNNSVPNRVEIKTTVIEQKTIDNETAPNKSEIVNHEEHIGTDPKEQAVVNLLPDNNIVTEINSTAEPVINSNENSQKSSEPIQIDQTLENVREADWSSWD